MSHDALNPEQFGFLPVHPWEEQEKISEHLGRQTWPSRKISLDNPPLRANQKIYPEAVDYYTKNPRGSFTNYSVMDNPTVIKHKGEHVVLSGHHRIAAAKRRGQKTMKVDWGETGE